MAAGPDKVVVGRIATAWGVRGWVKVQTFTEMPEQLGDYRQLFIQRDGQWLPLQFEESRVQGDGLVARLAGCEDRDQALAYRGSLLAIEAAEMPALPDGVPAAVAAGRTRPRQAAGVADGKRGDVWAAGSLASPPVVADDAEAIRRIRQLDAQSSSGEASRHEIQQALGCGGSRAARLARLARRQPTTAPAALVPLEG